MLHSVNTGTHSHADRGNDLYLTPPEAVRALLKVEQLPAKIWKPAAGYGHIVNVLRDAGHEVIASDLIDYGFELQFAGNFLKRTTAPIGIQAIVTNPPFKIATEFTVHALKLCPLAILLHRIQFLEAAKRTPLWESGQIARIHVFRERLPRMHRVGWTGKKAGSAACFAWFVFNRDHRGPATIDQISWRRP
jgi:hypothetical protein